MEPALSAAVIAEIIKLGAGGLLLLVAVVYLVKRDNAMQKADRARTDKAILDQKTECMDREKDNREACERRENDMAGRIRQLEDQRHKETSELLHRSVSALETTARVLEYVVDDDTGLQRALRDKR